jgi:hypothetical protein
MYIGQTSDAVGGFALFVDTNQNATLIGGYLFNDAGGDAIYGSCVVDGSGNGHSDIANVTTSFSISAAGSVSLNASADDSSFSFQMLGTNVSSGTFLSVSGFYRTNLAGSTDLEAIVAPDGWIYFSSPNHGGGGRAQVTAYGQAVTESSLGHSVSMFTLNQNATLNISSYVLNRVDSLPGPSPTMGAQQLKIANAQFIFSASGLTLGSTNIIQTCTNLNLGNWVSVVTNIANADTVTFTNTAAASRKFYRLMQLH